MTTKTYTIDSIEEGGILDQLIGLDGWDTVILAEEPILNGSQRRCGTRYTISADTAATISDPAAYEEGTEHEAAEWAEYFAAQD